MRACEQMKIFSYKFYFVTLKEIKEMSNKYSVTVLEIKGDNNCQDENK